MNRRGPAALAALLGALLLPACHAGEQAATAVTDDPATPARVLQELAAMPAPRAAHSATRHWPTFHSNG